MKLPENKEESILQEETLTSKLLKKGFWLYLFSYLLGPVGYFIRVLISNSVSVEEVGILYSIVGFVGLLSAYNGLGLTESLKYFIPQYYLKKQYNYIKTSVFWSLGVQILTSIFIILFLYFGADWFAVHYFHSIDAGIILQYFCLYFFAVNIFQVIGSVFLAFQDTLNNRLVEFVRMFLILSFTGLFYVFDMQTIVYYAWSWILGLFFSVFVGLIIFFRKYHTIFYQGKIVYDKNMLYSFWKYSLWTFLSMNVGVLLGLVDQQMVVVLLGPENAGYYSNYQSLLNVSGIFVGPIFSLLLPLFSEIFAKKDKNKLRLLQNFLYTYFGIFALSFGIFLAILGPEISSILFGTKFLLSGKLLLLGSGFFVLNFFVGVNFTILASMGKVKIKTFIALGVVFVNVLVNLLLFPSLGVYGAVVSTIIGWFLLRIISLRLVYKNCPIYIETKFILKNILLFLLLGGVVYLIKSKIFVLDDALRWENLLYIVLIGLVWYGLIGLVNIGKLKFLKGEVEKLRG